MGIIIPILKRGDKLEVNNYRGITLLPVIAKFLLTTLCRRIYSWAEEHKIIPDEQFDFRQNHRTTDALCVLNAMIECAKIKQTNFYCCFLDLKKTF